MSVLCGVYDPAGDFAASADMAIDSYYVRDWNQPLVNVDGQGNSLTQLCQNSAANNRVPLVTVYPFNDPKITKNPANLLRDINLGAYDRLMRNICAQMRAYGGPAYFCWAPGMDDPNNIGRFPWAVPVAQAADYASAFQRRIDVYRTYTNQLANQYFVWHPSGNANSYAYFPGQSFCDYVCCSAYGWSFYQSAGSGFNNVLGQKYGYMSSFNKPIIVETGCEIADDQATWADDMRASYTNFALLYAVCWYSAQDNWPWTPTGPVPNWKTTTDVWHA